MFLVGLLFGSIFYKAALRVSEKQTNIHGSFTGSRILYFLSGLSTGLLFLWVYLQFGVGWQSLMGLSLVSLSVIITLTDVTYMLIPNKILMLFLPVFVVIRLCYAQEVWWSYPLGAVVGGGLIILIILLTRGGMGMGDAKLFFLYGWALGLSHILLALLMASILSSLVSGTLLLLKIIKRKQPIPFGPYLALGTLISYCFGSNLIYVFWSY